MANVILFPPVSYRKKELATQLKISGKTLSRYCLSWGIWISYDTRKTIPYDEAMDIAERYKENPAAYKPTKTE